MQTFLPYADLDLSVECLDNKRLGKQRVEALQIHNIVSGKRTSGGWLNHPAVVMWRGYPDALALYHTTWIDAWVARGFRNTMQHIPLPDGVITMPPWFGDEVFHQSHRSNLLRKDSSYYAEQFELGLSPDLPYYWPMAGKEVNHG